MMNKTTRNFIANNIDKDIHWLALNAKSDAELNLPLALQQIKGMQKIKSKVPSFYACDELLYPVKLSLEQSSSEITARYKAGLCNGEHVVDLTGGFGVDSFFLSKSFSHSSYVERDAELCRIAKHNFKVLGCSQIEVIQDDAENYLQNMKHVDCIYIDPARRDLSGKKLIALSDCSPNVAELECSLLSKSFRTMIKLSPMLDIAALQKDLQGIQEIHIVAVENECKEIVVLLQLEASKPIQVKTVHFNSRGDIETFDFSDSEEKASLASYAYSLKEYLYEPNSAILKSGAFKLISQRFDLEKLHPNSQLYTSAVYKADFPGRAFKIVRSYDLNKKSIQALSGEVKQANIAVRNLPIHVEALRKKLKIAEGGDKYLFGSTLADNTKLLILCEKLKEKEQKL